jgi:hypothetical protein
MNVERLQVLAQALQAEVGCAITAGSLTLHFSAGRVQTVEALSHTRLPGASAVDKPPAKTQTAR